MFFEIVSFIVLTFAPFIFLDFLDILLPQPMIPHIPGLAAHVPHAGVYKVVCGTVVSFDVGRVLGVLDSL